MTGPLELACVLGLPCQPLSLLLVPDPVSVPSPQATGTSCLILLGVCPLSLSWSPLCPSWPPILVPLLHLSSPITHLGPLYPSQCLTLTQSSNSFQCPISFSVSSSFLSPVFISVPKLAPVSCCIPCPISALSHLLSLHL